MYCNFHYNTNVYIISIIPYQNVIVKTNIAIITIIQIITFFLMLGRFRLLWAVSIYTTVVQLILLGYSHDCHAANSPWLFTCRIVIRSFNMLLDNSSHFHFNQQIVDHFPCLPSSWPFHSFPL